MSRIVVLVVSPDLIVRGPEYQLLQELRTIETRFAQSPKLPEPSRASKRRLRYGNHDSWKKHEQTY